MHLDVTNFYQFYQTVLGGLVKRVLMENLDELWEKNCDNYICGLGYCEQFLEIYKQRGVKTLSLQSIYSGVYVQNSSLGIRNLLIDENHLPLADNSQTHILSMHLLEHTASPFSYIKEVARVLSPDNGEAIFIIPNRRGLWARIENTPFGHGKPYTKQQIIDVAEAYNLHIKNYKTALFFPPREHPPIRLYVNLAEYIGSHSFLSSYGGVHIIKLVKYAYVPPKLMDTIHTPFRVFPANLGHAVYHNN